MVYLMYNFYIAFVLYLNFCSSLSLSLSLSLSIYINKQGWVLFTGSLETELRQKYLFGPYILVMFLIWSSSFYIFILALSVPICTVLD